jgi:hypothetical protein
MHGGTANVYYTAFMAESQNTEIAHESNSATKAVWQTLGPAPSQGLHHRALPPAAVRPRQTGLPVAK